MLAWSAQYVYCWQARDTVAQYGSAGQSLTLRISAAQIWVSRMDLAVPVVQLKHPALLLLAENLPLCPH